MDYEYVGPAKVNGLPEGDISAEQFAKLSPELQGIVKRSGVYKQVDPDAADSGEAGKPKGGRKSNKAKPEEPTEPKQD